MRRTARSESSDGGVLEPRGHQVEEALLAQPERRPVELGVRDEARVLLAAGAVEHDLEDGRVLGAGQPVEDAKGGQPNARLPLRGAGKRVPRCERVVHASLDVLIGFPDGKR